MGGGHGRGGGPRGGEGLVELTGRFGMMSELAQEFRISGIGSGAEDFGDVGVQAQTFGGEQVVVQGLANEDVAEFVAGAGRQQQVAVHQFA